MPAVDEALQQRIEEKFTPPEQRKSPPEQPPIKVTEVTDDEPSSDEPEDNSVDSMPEAQKRVEEFYAEKQKPTDPEPEIAPDPSPLTEAALHEPTWTTAEATEIGQIDLARGHLESEVEQYFAFVDATNQLPESRERTDRLVQGELAREWLLQRVDWLEQAHNHYVGIGQQRLRQTGDKQLALEKEKMEKAGVDPQASKRFLEDLGYSGEEVNSVRDARTASIIDDARRWRALKANPTTAATPQKSALDRRVATARAKFKKSGASHDGAEFLTLKRQQTAQRTKQSKRKPQTIRRVR